MPNKQCYFQYNQKYNPRQHTDRWQLPQFALDIMCHLERVAYGHVERTNKDQHHLQHPRNGKYRTAAIEIGAVTKSFTLELPKAKLVAVPSWSTPRTKLIKIHVMWMSVHKRGGEKSEASAKIIKVSHLQSAGIELNGLSVSHRLINSPWQHIPHHPTVFQVSKR